MTTASWRLHTSTTGVEVKSGNCITFFPMFTKSWRLATSHDEGQESVKRRTAENDVVLQLGGGGGATVHVKQLS
jgi:hypothetical protein